MGSTLAVPPAVINARDRQWTDLLALQQEQLRLLADLGAALGNRSAAS